MARLPTRDLERIIERDLPGYRLVSRGSEGDAVAPQAEPDEVAADIDTLREKYLGDATTEETRDAPEADRPNMDDEIVTVEPHKPSDTFDPGARPKKVIVSGTSRRVIGSQG
jgi:hypothetical protein